MWARSALRNRRATAALQTRSEAKADETAALVEQARQTARRAREVRRAAARSGD